MFTTLAETYMTATRMDSIFAYRAAESERVRLLQIRQAEKKLWIAEQERDQRRLRRRALFTGALAALGRGVERVGVALTRVGQSLVVNAEPQRC